MQGNASSDQIAGGADAQSWDPSVKALTAFPQVLAQMDQNLQWTAELGNAYFNQPQDVMQAVQVMRQRAQAAGNLQSTPQEAVGYYQGNIALYPTNPQIVYVPAYNPWSVYGQPVTPYPGFSLLGALGSFFGSSPIQWGLGLAMQAFGHTPWGWLGWGLNWLTQSVLFNHSNYYSNSGSVADWHLPPNSMHAFSRMGTNGSYVASSYNRAGYNMRPSSGYKPGYGSGFVQQPQRSTYGYGQNYNRGYQSPGLNYARPTQEAYNRTPPMTSRPQQYSRPAYSNYTFGSNFNNRPAESFTGRSAPAFGNPMQTSRAPATNFAHTTISHRALPARLRATTFPATPINQNIQADSISSVAVIHPKTPTEAMRRKASTAARASAVTRAAEASTCSAEVILAKAAISAATQAAAIIAKSPINYHLTDHPKAKRLPNL